MFNKELDFNPILLSFYLSFSTVLLLLFICIPFSWLLSRTKNKFFKIFVESIIFLPLVLPPTVLGFYLLILFGDYGFLGRFCRFITGYELSFTFYGLIIGSCLYSLPFVIQPLQISFERINNFYINLSYMLGHSKFSNFINIILPLSKDGILKAFILGFSHTLGEFGIILMIGGNIPGETQVVSILIYELVEQLEYEKASFLSLIILFISIFLLFFLSFFDEFFFKKQK